MSVVVVSHTYCASINREKIYELAKRADVLLVTPYAWKDDLLVVKASQDQKIKHIRLPVLLKGHEKAYLYLSSFSFLKEHRPDIIYVEQGANAASYAQIIAAAKIFAPSAALGFFTWMNVPYTNSFLFEFIERHNLANTHFAVAGNHDALAVLRKRGARFPIEISPQLGVDPNFFRPARKTPARKKLGIPERQTVGFIGRLVEEKGLKTLLDASLMFDKSTQLVILGKGPLSAYIQEFTKRHGLSGRVFVYGSVPHMHVPNFLAAMDVCVLPSKTTASWKEQFGHVLIEAMACGIPVIGSSSGEIPNVVKGAGYVFPEGDSTALARAVDRALKPANQKALVRKGQTKVLATYTHEKIARRLLDLFARVKRYGRG